MSELWVASFCARDTSSALATSEAALRLAVDERKVVLVSSLLDDSKLVLGAKERAPSSERALRRVTTGPSATLTGRVLHHALALPEVAALERDASFGTLLNRNLRGFLRAYTTQGLQAQYFGREVVCLRRKPFALVGYEATREGAILLELFVGLDRAVVRPSADNSAAFALCELLSTDIVPEQLAQRVERAFCARYGLTRRELSLESPTAALRAHGEPVLQRVPDELVISRKVPIGVVEASVQNGRAKLFTDALCASFALADVELLAMRELESGTITESVLAPFGASPLDGAKPEDFLSVLQTLAASLAHER